MAVPKLDTIRRPALAADVRATTAHHLLLDLDALPGATPEELSALNEYVERRGGKSMYHHDRPMHALLQTAATKYPSTILKTPPDGTSPIRPELAPSDALVRALK